MLTVLERNAASRLETVARFAVRPSFRPSAYADGHVLLVEERSRATVFREFTIDGAATRTDYPQSQLAWCTAGGVVASGSANGVMVGTVRIALPPVRSLALHAVGDGRLLLHLIAGGSAREILGQGLHEGPVTSVAFASSDRIVTGGRDRSVCVASFDWGAAAPRFVVRRLIRTIRCDDVRFAGMTGPREVNMLRALADRSKAESAPWEGFEVR